jgi:hypothetical protein
MITNAGLGLARLAGALGLTGQGLPQLGAGVRGRWREASRPEDRSSAVRASRARVVPEWREGEKVSGG